MSVDDSGWGSDDGWQQPSGPQPTPPTPPIPPSTVPPGPSGPADPPGGSRFRKPLVYGVIGVVVIFVALLVIGLAAGGGSKHHKTPTAVKVTTPSSSGGGSVTTIAPPNSSPTTTPDTSATTDTTSTTSETPNQALLAAVPFTGCEAQPSADYVSQLVTTQVVCPASSVSSFGAEQLGYAAFTGRTAMADEYTSGFLQPNGIVAGTGDCQTLSLQKTDKGAEYCEGSVTDANGAVGHEVMVSAPLAAAITIGRESVATACQGQSGYTAMAFTLPDDGVLGLALTCTESPQVVQSFQNALTTGDLDLKS